jgi:HSP20 family protein
MKFSAPLLVAVAAMYPVVEGYTLWGPSFFEPSFALSPIRRQRALTRSFDDVFQQMAGFDDSFKRVSPHYEISNNSEQLQIALDLPGVKLEDLDVSVEESGKILTIRGHRSDRTGDSSFSSKFTQSFSLDPVIDVEKISANLMDGVLTVTAPKDMKRLEANIKSIHISPTAPPKMETPQLSAAEVEANDEDEVMDLDAHESELDAKKVSVEVPVGHKT